MQYSLLVRRFLWVLSLGAVVLVTSDVIVAQTGALVGQGPPMDIIDKGRPLTFEGTVLAVDGRPTAGAIVVSSAGGQAVTNEEGEYRLEVCVSRGAKNLQVTAVGRSNSKMLASQRVSLLTSSGKVSVLPLHLTQSSSCAASWLPTFGGQPGIGGPGPVHEMVVFDDGSGPALYVAGWFNFTGGVPARNIAKWNGSSWRAVGGEFNSAVLSLAVFNDGTGDALFVGGSFSSNDGEYMGHIAKWDGSSWSPLGLGVFGVVRALTVFDDGSGEALYAGGRFFDASGVAVNHIAKWDGANWSALGTGIDAVTPTDPYVAALAVFDDGGGDRLYAGGRFFGAGVDSANCIAKWDGSNWRAVGAGFISGCGTVSVDALAVFNDGAGERLVAGGCFDKTGSVPVNGIAQWDGANWSNLGGGLSFLVRSLAVLNEGNGEELYVGGLFDTAGGVAAKNVAKWDGQNWSALDGGLGAGSSLGVYALAVFDDGAGAKIYAGGNFESVQDGAALRIAQWNGTKWKPLGTGFDAEVSALAVFDDGSGPALHAAGQFTGAGDMPLKRIAKWSGSSWTPLGAGLTDDVFLSSVDALVVFDEGAGERLFAGGKFRRSGGTAVYNIARWDGGNWSPLASGVNARVHALGVFDDGNGEALFAGGEFTLAGGAFASRIAKWNGATWESVGAGLDIGYNSSVYALQPFDDGSGEQLFVGGRFSTAGAVAASSIAKWDGSNWTALGSGALGSIFALTLFDDGAGPALFAGGSFATIDGLVANSIAKWDGSSWLALGSGLTRSGTLSSGSVYALSSHDDGSGERLFVGGNFELAGGIASNHIAAWDGGDWQPLGSGMNTPNVTALASLLEDGSEQLYAGGAFNSALDSGDSYIAKWDCTGDSFNDHCNGDGGDQLGCTDCPCGNNAPIDSRGGCLNSAGTGARLIGSGSPSTSLPSPSVSDLRFGATGGPPNQLFILNSGNALAPANPMSPCFGLDSGAAGMAFDGLRCAIMETSRNGTRGTDSNGDVGVTNNPWGGESNPPGGIAQFFGYTAGTTKYFQCIHRDSAAVNCMTGLNTTQAIEVTFTP